VKGKFRQIKSFFLELLFPQFCFGCQREGIYLCQDCQSILDVCRSHQKYSTKNLTDLYFGLPYQNPLIKKLIQKFKYQPFLKELAKPLSLLIIEHFQLIEERPDFSDRILIPIPSEKKKLKWRGFNQAEEIAKEISQFFKIPLINDILFKIKETTPQVELSEKERRKNILGVFSCKNKKRIQGKKILLVDDIYTTGSTMEEAAKVLKKAGAKEIIGIVVVRASPQDDKFQNI